jgi:hypothetical protein
MSRTESPSLRKELQISFSSMLFSRRLQRARQLAAEVGSRRPIRTIISVGSWSSGDEVASSSISMPGVIRVVRKNLRNHPRAISLRKNVKWMAVDMIL